ncbi:mucin-1-like [Copidosoma floridanum]|nr:mucin-1-like [Copidosoma floridanum]
MQSVRSPPPIRSPQPNPSPRPVPSPRNQPVPSPRAGPVPSPHHHPGHAGGTPTHSPAHELGGPSEMMLSQLSQATAGGQPGPHPGVQLPLHQSPAAANAAVGCQDGNDITPMTPQDQLSKFVEGL